MLNQQAWELIAAHDGMNHEGIGCGCLDVLDALEEVEECPHHRFTDWSQVGPGWVCPWGCDAFVRDLPA